MLLGLPRARAHAWCSLRGTRPTWLRSGPDVGRVSVRQGFSSAAAPASRASVPGPRSEAALLTLPSLAGPASPGRLPDAALPVTGFRGPLPAARPPPPGSPAPGPASRALQLSVLLTPGARLLLAGRRRVPGERLPPAQTVLGAAAGSHGKPLGGRAGLQGEAAREALDGVPAQAGGPARPGTQASASAVRAR